MTHECLLPLRGEHRLTEPAAVELAERLLGVKVWVSGVPPVRLGVVAHADVLPECATLVRATLVLGADPERAARTVQLVEEGQLAFGLDATVHTLERVVIPGDVATIDRVFAVVAVVAVPVDGPTTYTQRGPVEEWDVGGEAA